MEAPPPPGHAAARDDRRDRGDRPGGGERVVLVRLSHLGDVVHALPVHHALRRALPAARLAWAVQPEFAGLLAFVPGLDVVVP